MTSHLLAVSSVVTLLLTLSTPLELFAQIGSNNQLSFRAIAPTTNERFSEAIAGVDHPTRYLGASPTTPLVAIGAPGRQIQSRNNVGAVSLASLDGTINGSPSTSLPYFPGRAISAMELYGSAVASVKNPTGADEDILVIGAPGQRTTLTGPVLGMIEFRSASTATGAPLHTVFGSVANSLFGKFIDQPNDAVWAPQARGMHPEILVTSTQDKRIYFVNISNGFSSADLTKFLSIPNPAPGWLPTPSLQFGRKSVAIDIIGDSRKDLVICDKGATVASGLDGAAYIVDGQQIEDYLNGLTTVLHPTAFIAPDSTTLFRTSSLPTGNYLAFCSGIAAIKSSYVPTGSQFPSEILFIGAPQANPQPGLSSYYGAIIAYSKNPTTGQPTKIGQVFGQEADNQFGYSLTVAKDTHLVIGSPRPSTDSGNAARIFMYDAAWAATPVGFTVAFRNPIMEETQSPLPNHQNHEHLLGQTTAASRAPNSEAYPIITGGSPQMAFSGYEPMAKGVRPINLPFISVGGSSSCVVSGEAGQMVLTANRDPTTGSVNLNLANGGPISFIAIFDPDFTFPENFVVPFSPPLSPPSCTYPFFSFPWHTAFGSSFLIPTNPALRGFKAGAIGISVDPVTGLFLTSNAILINLDVLP